MKITPWRCTKFHTQVMMMSTSSHPWSRKDVSLPNLYTTEKKLLGKRKKVLKSTTPGLSKLSPTLVLPRPKDDYLRRSDKIRCFHAGMVVDDIV